jgi:spermidine synthase
VIALARRYFGLREDARLRVVERDGRIFLRATREAYDVIMIDAYRGTFVPFHLTTREFFAIVKRKLAPGGVMVQNVSPEVLRPNDMIATIRSAFANVDQYIADGSVVLVAYDGPAKTAAQLTARATALQTAHRLRYPLGPMLAGRRANVTGQGGQVLTDNFAPVEFMRGIQQNNSRRN